MYATEIFSSSKSSDFFEEAVKEVHPTIKVKNTSKATMRSICKVFLQELAEGCFEVVS
jgi:hypothetical protein